MGEDVLHGNQGKHRVTKRGPALSYPMFTLVTGIVGRWRVVCVTALQRPNSDAAAIRIVVAQTLSVKQEEAVFFGNSNWEEQKLEKSFHRPKALQLNLHIHSNADF
ncbi:unnamed protein product [Ranitomeya imitator]|uniref:Uncharacterized protein n=1 Tax=Ranitomeya imitator TaxID=111125 RepID=A0ABN9L6C9_9NEOB|nr:unnamed protein product [Ranitomeya imitator]